MSLLLARRQERAFERLYRRHVAAVYRYAFAVLPEPADAESVTQATFVNAYRTYKRGERPAKPLNWLMGLAHEVCKRRSRTSDLYVPDDSGDDEAVRLTPSDLRRALDKLPFDERAALAMREVEGRSCAEIADLLGLGQAEVEVLIFRARRSLREQLEASLTCQEAERAVSRELDGHLPRPERKRLRAHLSTCTECAELERSQRNHRAAIRSFDLAPVPESLHLFRRRRVTAVMVARVGAVAATVLVVAGALTGALDPRQSGGDATRIPPAVAAPPVVRQAVTPRLAKPAVGRSKAAKKQARKKNKARARADR